MIGIVREKINLNQVLHAVEDMSTGGVVIFIGRVRNHASGREVVCMEYEGYDKMAHRELEKIAAAVRSRWPVRQFAMVHRLGRLELGEASVIIAVACAHRAEAFVACEFAIDALKKRLPVWKKEILPDGEMWVDGVKPELNLYEEDDR